MIDCGQDDLRILNPFPVFEKNLKKLRNPKDSHPSSRKRMT